MQLYSTWSERQSHIVRWALLMGWLLLILSLIVGVDPYPFDVNHCGRLPDCHTHEGNQIFWGMVVPSSLFILVVLSHEVWRRICPLAFVSQLFRALGRQRTVAGKGGRREVVKVDDDSWLGLHHVQLQWSLLVVGLSLRLLALNSSTRGLGVLLVLTILAALVVGWAYGGKAWCHYFCPMAPVQTVVTGPRSFFGSPAHVGTSSRITQSMCRNVAEDGRIQSACVACQTPCLDIDSERSYWQTLSGKRGLTWAWWSYPGLVIAFFLLIKDESRGGLDYLRSGMWAYDHEKFNYLLQPLADGTMTFGLPRLISIPALLVLSGWVSFWFFSWLCQVQQGHLAAERGGRVIEVASSRTRLLATFVAVNSFFWFADPTLGMAGPAGGQLIRSMVLIVSGMWLHRGWDRDKGAYTRESTSASLRKQLEQLIPDLATYLDGRSLQELSAAEVFTLAKVLPARISETKRAIYKGVMADLFNTGRMDRATSMLQLEELRRSLALVEDDHFATVRELAIEDPRMLHLDTFQRESRNLRQEAAAEAIDDLMKVTRTVNLNELLQRHDPRERLEKIRTDFALDEDSWEELLSGFAPTSVYARQRLVGEEEMLRQQLACRRSLELAAASDPLLRPLLQVMDRRITSLFVTIYPALLSFAAEDPLRMDLAALQLHFPASVCSQVRRRELDFDALSTAEPLRAASLDPIPDPADVVDALWLDPDPDTALWVLWVQQQRAPERAQALRRLHREGLSGSQALERLLEGAELEGADLMAQLLRVPLVAELSPGALFNLVRWGERRSWQPGEVLFKAGDLPDVVAILLEGTCQVCRPSGDPQRPSIPMATIGAGETIGEMAFFQDRAWQVQVQAGNEPVHLLLFSNVHFERLLQQSWELSRGLLHQQAIKIDDLYGGLTSLPQAAWAGSLCRQDGSPTRIRRSVTHPWQPVPGGIAAPAGFQASGITAGLKPSGKPDLSLLLAPLGSVCAGSFTTNLVRAACVDLCAERLEASRGRARAVLTNAGQANACTGDRGRVDSLRATAALAARLGLNEEEVLICSTGVIGVPIPMERLLAGLDPLVEALSREDGAAAARAILTTDLVDKQIALEATLGGRRVRIGGMAKGSGMIHPSMATLLAYLSCDAGVSAEVWRSIVRRAVEASFNAITVDGDTSTNDTLLAFAAGEPLYPEHYGALELGLTAVSQHLARAVARDGEGATCLIAVEVEGAASDSDARAIARTVCGSSLVKCAIHGRDPNWGRIVAAAGRAGVPINPDALALWLGDHQLMAAGEPIPFDRVAASSYMKERAEGAYLEGDTVSIRLSVGAQAGQATAWGCDLSDQYVRINADYTT